MRLIYKAKKEVKTYFITALPPLSSPLFPEQLFFFLRASSFVLSCLFKTYRETFTIVTIYQSVLELNCSYLQMNHACFRRVLVCARVMHVWCRRGRDMSITFLITRQFFSLFYWRLKGIPVVCLTPFEVRAAAAVKNGVVK